MVGFKPRNTEFGSFRIDDLAILLKNSQMEDLVVKAKPDSTEVSSRDWLRLNDNLMYFGSLTSPLL